MTHDIALGYDGGCTGFIDGIPAFNWNWSHCCFGHDVGGSDGLLLDCVAQATPGLPIVFVCLAITMMALCRPAYNALQRWGWVK